MSLSADDERRIRRLDRQDAEELAIEREVSAARAHCDLVATSRGSGGELDSFYQEHLQPATFRKGDMCASPIFSHEETTIYVFSASWQDNLSIRSRVRNAVRYEFPNGCIAQRFAGWKNEMLLVDSRDPHRTLKLRRNPSTKQWVVVERKGWKDQGVVRQIRAKSRGLSIKTA